MNEQFISNGNKSITIEGVKEAPIEELNIKGKTKIVEGYDFDKHYNMQSTNVFNRIPNTNIVTFTPTLNHSTVNTYPFTFKGKRLQSHTTYTLSYRVHYADADRVTIVTWNHGGGEQRLSLEPGFHHITFTTGVVSADYTIRVNLTRNAIAADVREIFRIEFFGYVVGEEGIEQVVTESFVPAGIKDKGIEIMVQNKEPRLGEYPIQGEIPGYLNYLEGKIVGNETTFDINWI